MLHEVSAIYRIIKVEVGVNYQPQPENTYLDLDYSGYHKNLIQYLFCYTLNEKKNHGSLGWQLSIIVKIHRYLSAILGIFSNPEGGKIKNLIVNS